MDRKGKLAYNKRLRPTARSDGRTRPSSGYLHLQKGASNLSRALSLKPTHPPQPHILPKVTCAAHTGKCMIFVLPGEPKSQQTPSPYRPKTALTGPMQASGGPAYR